MEEKKKNKGLVVTIIVLVLVVLGLTGFIVYDKVLKDNDTEVSDKEEQKNDNEHNLNNHGNNIVKFDAKKFFDKISTSDLYYLDLKVGELRLVKDFDINDLSAFIDDLDPEKIDICNSKYENDLIKKGIIGAKDVGSVDCSTVAVISEKNIIKKFSELFGSNLIDIPKQQNENANIGDYTLYYYEPLKSYLSIKCCSEEINVDLISYNSNLNEYNIDVRTNDSSEFRIEFNQQNDNFYLYSIKRIK